MADELQETLCSDDKEHFCENNSRIRPSQPDSHLPPKDQYTNFSSPTTYHPTTPSSQQGLATDCTPVFQTPPPGHRYPEPPPPGSAAALCCNQSLQGPYPGFSQENAPPVVYPNFVPHEQQQQQQQQQVFQTPLPGQSYLEPPPPGAAAVCYDLPQQGPYTGYTPQNLPRAGYLNFMPHVQQEQPQQQQPEVQTPLPGHIYPEPTPPGIGYDQPQPVHPYPEVSQDKAPPVLYPNFESHEQRQQQQFPQTPMPGQSYPKPPTPGYDAEGYDQQQQGPYPGYIPENSPSAGYPSFMPPMQPQLRQLQEQQQPPQPQQIVINDASHPAIIPQTSTLVKSKSYCGDIALACIVFFCCCCLFGIVAFILAVIASIVPYGEQSAQLSHASRGISIGGIIVGVIIIAVVIGFGLGTGNYINYTRSSSSSSSSSSGSGSSTYTCNYKVEGTCYKYREFFASSYGCFSTHKLNAVYSGYYCYYNYY